MTISLRQILVLPPMLSRSAWLLAGLSIGSLLACSSSSDGGDGATAGTGASSGSGATSAGTSSGGGSSSAGTGSGSAGTGSGSAGTGSGSAGTGTGPSGGGSSNGPELLGTFKVEVTADESGPTTGTTSVLGKVSTGATPSNVVWDEAATEGPCRLEKPRAPFCAPSCGSDVCVEDDVCRAYPTAQSVGAVTLSGVNLTGGGSSLELKEVAKAYQPPAGTTFAYPPFAEGDAVKVSAAGGDLPGFELETTGVSPFWLTSDDLMLEEGEPLELTWEAAADAKASSIHVKLDISHHGGSKGMIECDQDDTGSLSIPASLVSELLGLGVAGFPTVIVTRSASDRTALGGGEVALVVASTIERAVGVPGLESCTDNDDCPSGETCQADLTCQ
jgi:hypothetical protein